MDSEPKSLPRDEKELIDATRPFAKENRARSWFHLFETLTVQGIFLGIAATAPWLPVRILAGIVAGLVIVRGFILFHDFQHNAILRGSVVAKWIFEIYGLYVLTPSSVWKQTHNFHHANTAKVVGSHIGSYPVITKEMWEQATPSERRQYKIIRHPLTMLFGYLTIFLWGMCVSPFLRDKKRHKNGPLAVVFHVLSLVAITWVFGWQVTLTAHVLPLFVAFATGSYLFYAQHNFPGMSITPRETWTFSGAALHSSSYMECGPVMAWLTGNIGYHHVHHLNQTIPFYRLPEAMAAIPELRTPHKTTLKPKDILACLRLKVWDSERQEMVPYPS
jgi:acyl-lipid omega-6 desaturase (Delta-12 desaturase)